MDLPPDQHGFDAGGPVLRMIPEDVTTPPTRQDLQKTWPQNDDAPSSTTLGRWQKPATKQNLLTRLDPGRHYHPDRCWLVGKESERSLSPLDVVP